MRRLSLLAVLVSAVALAAAALWHVSEARRLGARHAALGERLARAETELRDALAQSREIADLLARTAQEREAERAQRREREQRAFAPMPEGVRLVVGAFNDCLRSDGFAGLRIVQASALADRELHDVEVLERAPDGLGSTVHVARRAELRLARASGEVTLLLREGHRWVDGVQQAYAADGHAIRVAGVHGPSWESKLPGWLRAEGEYPPPPAAPEPTRRLDMHSHRIWSQRLNGLLARARADARYRIESFAGLEDGAFRDVLCLAYGEDDRLLRRAIEARILRVIADGAAGTVELQFEDGVLRSSAGETKIPPQGHRILLSGIDPADAARELFGMLEQR
jgi:hypothetical protein